MTKGKTQVKQGDATQRGQATSPHGSSLEPQLALVGHSNRGRRGGGWLCFNYTSNLAPHLREDVRLEKKDHKKRKSILKRSPYLCICSSPLPGKHH